MSHDVHRVPNPEQTPACPFDLLSLELLAKIFEYLSINDLELMRLVWWMSQELFPAVGPNRRVVDNRMALNAVLDGIRDERAFRSNGQGRGSTRDLIVLRPGVYSVDETVRLDLSNVSLAGCALGGVTIVAKELVRAGNPVLRCSTSGCSITHVRLVRDSPGHVVEMVRSDLCMSACEIVRSCRWPQPCVTVTMGSSPELYNTTIDAGGAGTCMLVQGDGTCGRFVRCRFVHAGEDSSGVRLRGKANPTLVECDISRNEGFGIEILGNCSRGRFIACAIRDNGLFGLYVGVGAWPITTRCAYSGNKLGDVYSEDTDLDDPELDC